MKRAILLFVAVWWSAVELSAEPQTPVGSVTIRRPAPVLSGVSSRLHGIARPKMSATLRFLVPGTIAAVHVDEGQVVREGQPLVTLDDRLARARLRLARISANRKGELEYAAVQLKYGEKQLERLEQLFSQNAVAEREVEEQRALLERASAVHTTQLEELELARSNQALAEEQLRHMTIFAPFDGIITQLHEKLGVPIDPSTPVLSIANLDQLQVELHTPVSLYGAMTPGDVVSLKARQPVNAPISAKVITASPMINAASGTFRCVLEIDNSDRRLPAGFSVSIAE